MHLCLQHRESRISEYAEEKRIQKNLIVRSGTSEAEVTNNKRRRSRYRRLLLELITDRHEASRGLSAIAELLIMPPPRQTGRSGGIKFSDCPFVRS